MRLAALSASLLLLIFAVSEAIRLLKEGPMIDAEGREYKTLRVNAESLSGPQLSDVSPVRVQCTEATMIVVVKADLFKTGRLVSAEELFLGEAETSQSSRCRAAAAGDSEYVIEAGLQDCGSRLSISEDSVIYSNNLVVSPAATYHGITRTAHAVVPVSCHYQREHVVSSHTQQPPLTRSSPTQRSAFSLKLMTDDWTRETFSRVFHLGDVLHLQASYSAPDSAQRRLFIDSCVATLSPDVTSVPRYYFIENNGCLTDARDGGSNTRFRSRRRADSLQLLLGVFLFHQDARNSIFITCQLKATADMWKSSPVNKACNYEQSRWENVDGSDDVCRCCDGTCYRTPSRWSRVMSQRRPVSEDNTTCGSVMLGPLMIFPSK
uniref:zona pellucida sperm-binding protein 3-like n=1 Tax=Semicossyphus pulcher TaxID=241346 RepID=UPI0037E9137C